MKEVSIQSPNTLTYIKAPNPFCAKMHGKNKGIGRNQPANTTCARLTIRRRVNFCVHARPTDLYH